MKPSNPRTVVVADRSAVIACFHWILAETNGCSGGRTAIRYVWIPYDSWNGLRRYSIGSRAPVVVSTTMALCQTARASYLASFLFLPTSMAVSSSAVPRQLSRPGTQSHGHREHRRRPGGGGRPDRLGKFSILTSTNTRNSPLPLDIEVAA